MSVAEWIIEQCDTEPPTEVEGHPDIFSDLEDERVHNALLELWQIGVVDAEWDEEDEGTDWWLTEFGVELEERGLTRPYITATEEEIQVNASINSMTSLGDMQ